MKSSVKVGDKLMKKSWFTARSMGLIQGYTGV